MADGIVGKTRQGWRLNSDTPLLEGDGISPQLRKELGWDSTTALSRSIVRIFAFIVYIFGSLGVWVSVNTFFPNDDFIPNILAIAAFWSVCGAIDQLYIRPISLGASKLPVTILNEAFKWNEGLEIGYLNYRDIVRMMLIDPETSHPNNEGASSEGEPHSETPTEDPAILVEDAQGKRLGVAFENSEERTAMLTHLKARATEAEMIPTCEGEATTT